MNPQSNPKTPASLETLPSELLQPIFKALCSHCCTTPGYQNRKARKASLRSLTLTSRRLRSIALPILLHIPMDHTSDEGLHKILDLYPGLGSHIKVWELPGWENHKEKRDFLKETTRRLLATVDEDIDFEQAENEGLSVGHSLATELFMARAPTVETLLLERYDWNEWPDADLEYLARRLGKLGDGTGFENVRHLRVSRPCRTSTSLTDTHLLALLGVMPKLERLELESIVGLAEHDGFDIIPIKPALQNLTTLRLRWCTFEGEDTPPNSHFAVLCEMLKHTPNLASFTFSATESSGDPAFIDHEVSVKSFVLALQPVSSHLRHLELDFSDAWGEHGELDGPVLADFTALESCSISCDAICQCHRECWDEAEPTIDPCAADIIPPTVKHLHFLLRETVQTGCSSCILGIGRKVAEGGLQALERVEIHYSCGMLGNVKDPHHPMYDEVVDYFQDCDRAFRETPVSLWFKSSLYKLLRRARGGELARMQIVVEDDDNDYLCDYYG